MPGKKEERYPVLGGIAARQPGAGTDAVILVQGDIHPLCPSRNLKRQVHINFFLVRLQNLFQDDGIFRHRFLLEEPSDCYPYCSR